MFDFDAFQKMKHIAQEALNTCKERIPTQRDRILEQAYLDCFNDDIPPEDAFKIATKIADYFMDHKNDKQVKKCKCSDAK